jgi:hypothetical protein
LLQQIGQSIPGKHHAPIRYLSSDASIAVRQQRRIGNFTAVAPFPFHALVAMA